MLPIHDRGQVVDREADAVVGYAALGVVVGADFVRPVAAANHVLAGRAFGFVLLGQLDFVDPRAKHLEGLIKVLSWDF